MYNPENQFRCTIIRGKAQTELDDLLITYASIVNEVTPTDRETFNNLFNDKLSLHFYKMGFDSLTEDKRKTIRNHITEISEKLFALSYVDEQGIVFSSESCQKILEDNDQPAFFKNLCFNFQQPNGTQKIQTVEEKISAGVKSRPLHLVLAVLRIAQKQGIEITKSDLAFYLLNSLDALQGWVRPIEIIQRILEDRTALITREFDWGSSRDSQHIREQLNLLSLANLIHVDGQIVKINLLELKLIDSFVDVCNTPIEIDPDNYNLSEPDQRKKFYSDWNQYNGSINIEKPDFLTTTVESLGFWNSTLPVGKSTPVTSVQSSSLKEIGDEGEFIVLEFEKTRVSSYNPRLTNKVIHVGGTKGLGYDILSVEADELISDPEFARYIEVKTTKRSTVPDFSSPNWYDTINLTKREWIVARQFGPAFNIYRVYLTPSGNKIIKLGNPHNKSLVNEIIVEPVMYRLDFENKAIDLHYK
jgi:hypothetical protein